MRLPCAPKRDGFGLPRVGIAAAAARDNSGLDEELHDPNRSLSIAVVRSSASPPPSVGRRRTRAQAWPTKTINLVVPFAAGGPTDVMARTLSVSLAKSLGQSVVVENKVGAGGTIAAGYVAKAAPDGYTIFLHHNGMASSTALYRKLAFNPLTDFEYVSQVADVPMTLLARKDFPAANLGELIAYVKANKEKINLANAGLGAVSHLCGMLFQQALGVDLQTIPFAGTAPAMNALLGGQVDLMCDQTTQTIPHIKAGSVRFYGVTTRQRIKALPDAPTLASRAWLISKWWSGTASTRPRARRPR